MNKDKDPKEGTGDARVFDRRTLERSIKRGLISRKDYEKFLKTLPDSAEKVRPTDS